MITKKMVIDFIKFVKKELKLKSLPKKFIVTFNNEFPAKELSLGSYNPDDDTIRVYAKQRHVMDIFRTLAHEMEHHKQKENHKKLDNKSDSETENDANAVAGELMRKYAHLHPELFGEVNEQHNNKTTKLVPKT